LNAIYEMVSKISYDLVKNYERPEEDSWNNHYWGIWPIDKKEKIIYRPLKISTTDNTLQPWHKILENSTVDLKILGDKEIKNNKSVAGEIKKLDKLRKSGVLTKQEFNKAKARLLN